MLKYKVGDVLVQVGGEPWPTLAWIATGAPNPHASVVASVDSDGKCLTILESHADGIQERAPWNLEWFEVWRPNCEEQLSANAVEWIRQHRGQVYAYHKLLGIAVGTRLGLWQEPEEFDHQRFDCEPMYCSETIARAFWRCGYDLVPGVSNRNTLPCDLKNPRRLTLVWQPPKRRCALV